MRFLLDTNIVSDLIRNPHGRVTAWIRAVGEDAVCTSVVVAAELRYGVRKNGSSRLSAQLDAILGVFEICPFESPADVIYGVVRVQLEEKGTPIGGNDLLIAAHALALNCTLVTNNEREFTRVEGLDLRNWLSVAPVAE